MCSIMHYILLLYYCACYKNSASECIYEFLFRFHFDLNASRILFVYEYIWYTGIYILFSIKIPLFHMNMHIMYAWDYIILLYIIHASHLMQTKEHSTNRQPATEREKKRQSFLSSHFFLTSQNTYFYIRMNSGLFGMCI